MIFIKYQIMLKQFNQKHFQKVEYHQSNMKDKLNQQHVQMMHLILKMQIKMLKKGGKSVSFGSDAHDIARIGDKRDEVIEMLKRIGFRSVTVPYRGAVMEHIEVEI